MYMRRQALHGFLGTDPLHSKKKRDDAKTRLKSG